MNTTELGELLRDATADLAPSPDFAEQVIRGGRRRQRHRFTLAASVVVAIAVAVTGTVVALRATSPAVTATDELLTTPTRGDLAGDRAFLTAVVRVWTTELPSAQEARFRLYDDPRGDPHVIWAGNTAVGRAAVVVQEIHIHQDYWVHADDAGTRLARGLVAIDPEDDELKLVATLPPNAEPGAVNYFMFGPMDRTMLIVDEGEPLHYSTSSAGGGPEYLLGGSYRPEWRRVQAHDGVAMVSVTDTPGPGQGQRILAYQGDHPPAVVDVHTRSVENYQSSGAHLPYRLPDPTYRLPIPNFFPWQEEWILGTPVQGVDVQHLQFNARPRGEWQIVVWSTHRVVVLQETMVIKESSTLDSKGSVLSVVTGTIVEHDLDIDSITAVDLAVIDHDAALPVRYRVPDGGGWVVARKGEPLSYRAQGGKWQDAGEDAALVPDDTAEVKVGDDVVTL